MFKTNNKGNITIYSLCVVVGIVVGILAGMAFSGGMGSSGDNPVVAEYNGKSVRASEVFSQVKTRLFDLEEEVFRTKEQAIREFVEQRLLDDEAKKSNMPVQQLLDQKTGGEVAEVTDKDIEAFLTSKGLSLKDPRIKKDDVKEYLKYRQKFEKRQAYVEKLRESAKIKILVKEPESPKLTVSTDGYPSWGNAKAPVTIVEFSDFQCPFCSRAVPIIDRIKKEYGQDKVRIVFRDMPLPNHNRALPASLAARCANEQGKFWEMHNTLFENQQKLEDKDLKDYAKTVGLDVTKFNQCYDSKKYMGDLEKSRSEAESVGIAATPSFLINGVLLQGAQPFEKFKEKIDRASKQG
ncbi:MAG: hypothetical protein EBR01_09595 [Proteobacteria bacterium]|nr:hypothetical protein [Pseudomonadota bacterium]